MRPPPPQAATCTHDPPTAPPGIWACEFFTEEKLETGSDRGGSGEVLSPFVDGRSCCLRTGGFATGFRNIGRGETKPWVAMEAADPAGNPRSRAAPLCSTSNTC